jgi:hypothetical protein
VLLLWGALRRERAFSFGMLLVGSVGLLASLAVFGVADHLSYLELLSMIARSGEVYWANQSINGIAHRFLETGSPLEFANTFGAPHAGVGLLTTVSTALLLGTALWPPARDSPLRAAPVDLALCVVAATIASPVAWEHHYGSFLAVFAVVAPLLDTRVGTPGLRIALLASFLLVANGLDRPALFFTSRWSGLLGAHTFWGGLTLLVVLHVLLRRRASPRPA